MADTPPVPDSRTTAQLQRHYEIETALAARLLRSPRVERLRLYTEIYDELYRQVPDHPMLTRKISPKDTGAAVERQVSFLSDLLTPTSTVLELGCGDCSLSAAIASQVARVIGVEVSRVIADSVDLPDNFELVISDGIAIPVADCSIDLAYSNQLMEHLHPEDAADQLKEIFRCLKPGGVYVCKTPHRLQGPTDISYLHDNIAAGLHLKEYTLAELRTLMASTGFSRIDSLIVKSGRRYRVPGHVMLAFERICIALFGSKSYKARDTWLQRRPFNVLRQGISVAAYKEAG